MVSLNTQAVGVWSAQRGNGFLHSHSFEFSFMQWIQPRIWRQMCSSLAHFAKNYRRAPLAASMLCALLLAGCQSDLYASLDERQANESSPRY